MAAEYLRQVPVRAAMNMPKSIKATVRIFIVRFMFIVPPYSLIMAMNDDITCMCATIIPDI